MRTTSRYLARGLSPLLAKTKITGLEKIPKKGPLILVGNHTGSMEVVLMMAYAPRTVEFMGAMEIPWNGWMGWMVDLYNLIPVYRGTTGLTTMKTGVDVLKQDGMLGLFPEGGFWEPGLQKAQAGVAWLSYQAQAPVLPIGFNDTRGKLAALFRLERPYLEMHVGDLIPPVQLNKGMKKKEALQQAADEIMDAVWALVPEEAERKNKQNQDEEFFMEVEVHDQNGVVVPIPVDLALTQCSWISRFAHRPNLIDSVRDYIFIPVQVLKELDRHPPAEELRECAQSMIDYVEKENEQYFNYRYGYEDGQAFHTSFYQLRDLMQWVIDQGYSMVAEVIYEYTDPDTGEHMTTNKPMEIEQW